MNYNQKTMKKLFSILLFITTIANAQIINIPDANLKAKLISIGVDVNSDGDIQMTEANFYLNHLDVSNANISDLTGVEYFSMAYSLNCSGNNITSLILPNTNIDELNCSNNPNLTSLNLINLPNLLLLNASNCNISSVVLDNLAQLSDINFDNNNLDVLDISASYLPSIMSLFCKNNDLKELYIKNGLNESLQITLGNPNLNIVCCDDSQISNVQLLVPVFCVVSSYCSFVPGGNYNTISGAIIYDENNNGCDVLDLPQPNIKIDINDGVNQGATFTNNTGNYKFYTNTGNFTITPNMENTTWFTVSPNSVTIPFANNSNNVVTQNFCITPNGIHPDLEIVVEPIVPARPGFDAVYKIVYKNKGNQSLSQAYGVSFFYNENVMDFVSATVAPESINSGGLSWSYTNLLPFENRSILITMNINSPTDTDPVNIGDVLQFTTSILPMAGDETTTDNLFQYNQTVVGAYDPNNIVCLEGDIVSPTLIGEYLHYAINFENTGNIQAENVVVKLEVNPNDYDINTLRLLNTSHNSYTKVNGNVVEFIFENVNLAPTNGNGGGHGNILLKIKSKNNLQINENVLSNAKIYFDYNIPIITNDANTVFSALNNDIIIKDVSISLFPNPVSSFLNVKSENKIKSIELYDVQGRIIQIIKSNFNEVLMNMSNCASGVYFVKVTSDFGFYLEKIIKK